MPDDGSRYTRFGSIRAPASTRNYKGDSVVKTLKIIGTTFAMTLSASAFSAAATGSPQLGNYAQLPEIRCSGTHCSIVQPTARNRRMHALAVAPMDAPATPSTTPVAVGPPAGQRFMWQGAGYPACQSLAGASMSSPYTYINATQVPVPLGSTHISLFATLLANISGGPTGAAGDFVTLQVKPSASSTWTYVDTGYAASIYGSTVAQNLYNSGTFHGLVDLASLNGGTVPSEIDIRVQTFPLYVGGFNNVAVNAVCGGQLQLSF